MNPLEHLNEIVSYGPMGRDEDVVFKRSKCSTFVYCVCKHIHLENGGEISVQASNTAYCTPRDDTGPYTSVEVGYPEGVHLPDSWEQYADYWGDDGRTWRDSSVFAYVPVELVHELILENCPKLRKELEGKEAELVKDTLNASDRKDWFNKILR